MFLLNKIVFTDSFYYIILSNKFSYDRILDFISLNKNIQWISYIFFPILFTIRIFCISVIIFIGIKLFEIDIILSNCFKVVLLAEIISLFASITRTLYFYIYQPSNLEELQFFNPLGLSIFLKIDTIPKYLLYPIQQLNLFEVGYFLLLAYGIKINGKINYKMALQITSLSYGVGLAIWCIFIVFFQLQFS